MEIFELFSNAVFKAPSIKLRIVVTILRAMIEYVVRDRPNDFMKVFYVSQINYIKATIALFKKKTSWLPIRFTIPLLANFLMMILSKYIIATVG